MESGLNLFFLEKNILHDNETSGLTLLGPSLGHICAADLVFS